MKKYYFLLMLFIGVFSAVGQTLGTYNNATLISGQNTTVTPSTVPTGTTSIVAYTNSNFTGVFSVNPTTGVVSITAAKQAGTFTVTVKAFGSGTATTTFTLTVTNPICSQGLFTGTTNISVGSNAILVAIGDFNGDGKQDFASTNDGSSTVSIRLGDGLGGFSGTTNISVGSNPRSVAIGDFNGDGKQDFAAANHGSNTVSIRLGNGSGGFSGTTNVSVGSAPRSVAIGDFNGDGKQDFAAVNEFSNNVSIRLGDGSGGFSGTTNISVGTGPLSVAIGDFNGDGIQDFAAANYSNNNVSIRLGDGSGGFSGTTNVGVESGPFSVAIGDFNADGKQDFAAANYGSNTVSIRLGNGSGLFTGTTNIGVQTNPYSVAIGDFNGDGKQDFAAANQNSSSVSIRLGNGSGGFSGTTDVGVPNGTTSVAIGDFNGDGTQDFAAANYSSNVSIRLGITVAPTFPTFPAVAPICAGGSLSALPTTSNNSITGTWSPALNNAATTIYTFTPTAGQCGTTATLMITVNPLTTIGNITTSICAGQSYIWPANNQTYTTAQTNNTFVSGCNTATLNLAVTPLTTTGSASVSACGTSYTWPTSGLSYIASGVYPFVSGCNTATLTLTLNTSFQTFYADTDGDGFGAGAAILSCEGQPVGTSTNNTDCAPTDATKWRSASLFVDADNDGYNNGFPASSVCYGATTPSGFVAVNNGVDCNDNSASVNPNASEIAGNSIDDNCDGTSDEVTALSSLLPASCGITLTNLATSLFAQQLTTVGPVQGYRFRVTNGSNVRTIDRLSSSFALSQLVGGATYATTYTVEVSVKSNGFYSGYGASCTVTTPAVPNSTFIANPSCGSTLADISNSIFCVQVPTASAYRFRVRNGATVVGTVDRPINRFSLMDLGISNLSFGTTYTIDVLLAFEGIFRPEAEYGPTCSITTPAAPGRSRVISPTCGTSISNLWTTFYAQQVVGAQGYKFVVTNGAQTREFTTANARFQLPLLAGGAAASTVYTIRVDVLNNASYVQGTVLCTITTTAGATRLTDAAIAIYEVNATPNPYAETFKLNVNSSSEDQVSVQVYDMLGRQVETRQATVANITNLEIGSQYPSGVYNVIVSQGSNVKTVRVIKR